MARTYYFQVTNNAAEIIGTVQSVSTTEALNLAVKYYGADNAKAVKRITFAQAQLLLSSLRDKKLQDKDTAATKADENNNTENNGGTEMTFKDAVKDALNTKNAKLRTTKLEGLLEKVKAKGDQAKIDEITGYLVVDEMGGKMDTTSKASKKASTSKDKADKAPAKDKKAIGKKDTSKAAKADKKPTSKKAEKVEDAPKATRKAPDRKPSKETIDEVLDEVRKLDTGNENGDGKFKVIGTNYDKNGNAYVMTYANNKGIGKRYRTLIIGFKGGVRAFGCKKRGTPKLMTATQDAINFGYLSEAAPELGHPEKNK